MSQQSNSKSIERALQAYMRSVRSKGVKDASTLADIAESVREQLYTEAQKKFGGTDISTSQAQLLVATLNPADSYASAEQRGQAAKNHLGLASLLIYASGVSIGIISLATLGLPNSPAGLFSIAAFILCVTATILGILAWKSVSGKITTIAGIITLVVLLFTYPASRTTEVQGVQQATGYSPLPIEELEPAAQE